VAAREGEFSGVKKNSGRVEEGFWYHSVCHISEGEGITGMEGLNASE